MLTGKRKMRQIAQSKNALCPDFDFQIDVLLAPEERDSSQPILALDGFPGSRPVFRRKHADSCRKLWASDFSTYAARRDINFGVVSYSLVFAGVAAGHHIELVIFFAEPDRSVYRIAILAEAGKRHIFLALDFRG